MDAAVATPEKRKTPIVAIKHVDKPSVEKKVVKKEPEDNQAQGLYAPIENDPYYQKEDAKLAQAIHNRRSRTYKRAFGFRMVVLRGDFPPEEISNEKYDEFVLEAQEYARGAHGKVGKW